MVSRLLPGSDEPLVIFKELIPQKAIKGILSKLFPAMLPNGCSYGINISCKRNEDSFHLCWPFTESGCGNVI
jgi:hypothetical protein